MTMRKLSLFPGTVSLLALSVVLSGCSATSSVFRSEPVTAEQTAGENYQQSLALGDKARTDKKLDEAAGHYARAARWMPTEAWPLIQLADVLWEMQNPAEAVKVLNRAHTLDPNSTLILKNLGRAHVALNQPAQAQESYLDALAIDPNDTKILNGLAIAYDMDGDHATAQRHYRAGLALQPQNLDLQNNLSYSLIASGKYADAVDILEPLVNRADATPRQRQNLALAYGLLGKEEEVRRVSKVDLTPAQIEKNLVVYRHLRAEPGQPDTLRTIGRPTFASGGLTTVKAEAPAPAAPPTVAATAPTEEVAQPQAAASTPVAVQDLPAQTPAEEKPVVLARASEDTTPAPAPKAEAHAVPKAEAVPVPEPEKPAQAVAETTPSAPVVTTTEAAPAATPPAPAGGSGFGSNKIYLGLFPDEAAAREAWIKVWVNNSATLGNMAAGIEPQNGQVALYAVGADTAEQAENACTTLRQAGVSCGVSR